MTARRLCHGSAGQVPMTSGTWPGKCPARPVQGASARYAEQSWEQTMLVTSPSSPEVGFRRMAGSYRGLIRREAGLVRRGARRQGEPQIDWASADSTGTTTAAVGNTNGTPPWVGHPVGHVGERVSECGEFVENLQRVQG
jgi:hypothetical protein